MMSKDWEFRLKNEAAWYWRAVDRESGVVLEADDEFATLFACVKDAERHGYYVPVQCDAWFGTV